MFNFKLMIGQPALIDMASWPCILLPSNSKQKIKHQIMMMLIDHTIKGMIMTYMGQVLKYLCDQ